MASATAWGPLLRRTTTRCAAAALARRQTPGYRVATAAGRKRKLTWMSDWRFLSSRCVRRWRAVDTRAKRCPPLSLVRQLSHCVPPLPLNHNSPRPTDHDDDDHDDDDVRMVAAAADRTLAIGRGGQLPWDLPEVIFFERIGRGGMGRVGLLYDGGCTDRIGSSLHCRCSGSD